MTVSDGYPVKQPSERIHGVPAIPEYGHGGPIPLNYNSLLATDASVIFIGESHYDEGIHRDLAAHAAEIAACGVRAVLLEAPEEQDFTAINNGDFSRIGDLDLGIDLTIGINRSALTDHARRVFDEVGDNVRRGREALVRALIGAGVPVFPIDKPRGVRGEPGRPPQPRSPETVIREMEDREATLTGNTIHYEREYGKVLELIGRGHTRIQPSTLQASPQSAQVPFKWTALRLQEAGILVQTIEAETEPLSSRGTGASSMPSDAGYMYADPDGRRHMVVPPTADELHIKTAMSGAGFPSYKS